MTSIDVAASGTLSIVADDPEAVPSLINGSGQYGLRAQVYTDLAEALDCAGRVAPDAWVVAVGDPTFAWGICGLLRSCSEERLRAIPIFLVLSESSMQQMAPALEAQAIYLCSDALTSPDALLSQISRRLSGRTVRPLRVLLCSSHIDQAILHVTALRQAGHMVYWATGVQTPRHGWLADYDVLLIDAAAASPDGMLCVGNGVRCVAYNVDPSSTREWLERGVVRCLESPCTPHELRDALEALPIPSPEGGGTPVQEPARDRVLQSVHHSAMAAADMGVWEWDVDSGTNWWSPELWRLYDLDQTVVPSYEAWLSSVHPDQRDALHHAVQQAIASSEPIRIEWRVATRDGSERWLAARGDLDRTPGRVTRRYIGAVADVTERRRMEEHAMTLAHMLDVAPNAITVHDDSGRFLYANQQTFTMHGIDPEAFLATNLYDLDTPESAALILQRIHELDQAGDLTFEVDHYRGDGSVIPLEVYARRVVWQGRRAVLSVARDISKRRQAQRQLADSERFLRAVLESMVDGFWVVEADGTLSDVNPAYCHMMGYTRDALIGKTVGDIDLLETPRQTAERMARIWEKGSEMFETVHRRADGRPLDVEMSVTYLPEKGGRYVCFCRDITERKRTAEALQQLTRRMMLATRIGQIGVWEYDVETGRCFWDDTQFEMFGLPTGDSFITMDTWLERVHPEDVERIRREIASFDLHKGLYETEYRAVRPNGQVRFIRVMAVGVADEVGRIRRVVGVNTDITDFRQAEAQLRASEAQYRALVESIPDYVVRYDRDARMLYVSPNLSAASGIPAEHYIGRTQRELGSPPELCDLWESAVRQVVADGRPYETEFAMTSASGEVATFNWRLVPQFGEDGTVETVLSIARDVSAQRRLEQDYEQLFQQMAEGFVLLEPVGSVDQPADYRFCTVNRAFETLCGLTAHEVIGRTVRDFWPDVNPRWFECFSHVLRTGAPLQLQEWSDEIHKHLSVSVYRPSPTRVAMVFSDITEHLKSQQEQTRLQAQLTQAQKMESIGRLAGGVAHDFNNMLGVIIGRTDMLMRQEMPAAVARGVQEIRRAAKSSADLTRQLLAFARQQDVTPQSVDLNEALSGMLKMLRRLIGEHL